MLSFVNSGKKLQVLSGSVPHGAALGVIDASFNPPNNAHLRLGHILRNHNHTCSLVLLLATGNADKPAAPIAELETRLEMLKLFAQEFKGSVCIALTSEALFVAKSQALKQAFPASKQLFAMGIDTVQRLFDQRYYREPVYRVLGQFFSHAEIIALTRKPDEVSGTPAIDMSPYLQYPQVYVLQSDASTDQISSSRARQALANGDWPELERQVPAPIAAFLRASTSTSTNPNPKQEN